jgi:uncharacterized protein YjiS (DUF1127 family)
MTTVTLSATVVRSRGFPRWNELLALLVEWRQRVRSRYELMALNDRDLADMGLSRLDACNECDKPFWQA